jgi:hypothetical protein
MIIGIGWQQPISKMFDFLYPIDISISLADTNNGLPADTQVLFLVVPAVKALLDDIAFF